MSLPPPPTYDRKESLTKYIQKVEEYKMSIIQAKYNIILTFINDLLDLKKYRYKALTQFQNIYEDYMFQDEINIIKVLTANSESLKKNWDIEVKTDPDTLRKEVIMIISRLAESIDYKLCKSDIEGKVYYTIKKN